MQQSGSFALEEHDTLSAAVTARFASIAALPADWDTYGAQPIAPRAIVVARALIHALALRLDATLAEPYFIAPLPYGGVQVEWRAYGQQIEVEVDPDGALAYLFTISVGEARTFVEKEDATEDGVLRVIERWYRE